MHFLYTEKYWILDKCWISVVAKKTNKDGEAIRLGPIKEVGGGRYEASFTVSRCGYYMISIIVNGHHIPGSPYR